MSVENGGSSDPRQTFRQDGNYVNPNGIVRSSSEDEIDLVDLVRFVWRVRIHLVLGALGGLILAVIYSMFLVSPKYISRVSLSIDPASLPAIDEPKKLVEVYTSVIGSPDMASLFFQKLAEQSPEFVKNLNHANRDLADLVAQQSLTDKPENVLIKLLPSSSTGDYFVEATLPVDGFKQDMGKSVAEAVNAVADAQNAKSQKIQKDTKLAVLQDAGIMYKESEVQHKGVRLNFEKEMVALRTELAQLEFSLARRAKAAGLDVRNLEDKQDSATFKEILSQNGIKANKSDQSGVTSSRLDTNALLPDVRVIGLLGALIEDKKIPISEAQAITTSLADIQVKAERLQTEFATTVSGRNSVLETFLDATGKAAIPVNKAATFLPKFTVNESLFNQGAKVYEQKKSKTILYCGLGFLLGTFAGGAIGGAALFLRSNKSRFGETPA